MINDASKAANPLITPSNLPINVNEQIRGTKQMISNPEVHNQRKQSILRSIEETKK